MLNSYRENFSTEKKMYDEIGSPCLQQWPSWKKFERNPAWETAEIDLFMKTDIHLRKEGPNLKYSMVLSIKFHDTESKAFSKSIINKVPGKLFSSVYCIKSYTRCVFSPIYRPGINPDWSELMILWRSFLILPAMHPEPILYTTFNTDIGLQFFLNRTYISHLLVYMLSPLVFV